MFQIFTSQPQRWAVRPLSNDEVAAFRDARHENPVATCGAHDSYLINLATEDSALFSRSNRALVAELHRCERLGLDFLVTHPGNATGGDRRAALRRNARALGDALEEVPGRTRLLIETTAGSGRALGWRFEELAELLERIQPARRVGVCLDTAHLFAAGYDLSRNFDAVIEAFDRTVGLERVGLLHLNDSKTPCGSRVDRHQHIGKGEMGAAAFRQLFADHRLRAIPGVLETPKGDDPTAADRRNLRRLRKLAGEAGRGEESY